MIQFIYSLIRSVAPRLIERVGSCQTHSMICDSRISRNGLTLFSRSATPSRLFALCTPLLLLLALFAACSSKDIEEPDTPDGPTLPTSEAYYITLDVSVPTSLKGRADNDNNDELASAKECEIESADIYFLYAGEVSTGTPQKNEVLLKLSTDGSFINKESTETEKAATYKIRAKINDISDLKVLTGKKISLLVVCNPGQININNLDDPNDDTNDDTNTTHNYDASVAKFNFNGFSDPLGDFGTTGNLMPMSNTAECTTEAFLSISGDGDAVLAAIRGLFTLDSSGDMVKSIGTLDVERSVARLDIAHNTNYPTPWTYDIQGTDVNLMLYSIQPFNVNKESYLVRHRAAGDATAAKEKEVMYDVIEPADATNSLSWVVDPTWGFSTSEGVGSFTKTVSETRANTFYNPLNSDAETGFSINGGLETKIVDIQNRDKIKEFIPWCYVSENTLPSETYWSDDNIAKYATGVAFKFVVMDNNTADRKPLKKGSAYLPSNIQFEDDDIIITTADSKWMQVSPDETDGCYYLTYYGFITENNPMDYGVVRNTVYQMSITKIGKLPDPEEPKNLFLSLEIKVLAWAKRDIDVSF